MIDIEKIPFDTFQALTNCPCALKDAENRGCQWYAASRRREAGRIYIDIAQSAFRFSVLRCGSAGWQITEGNETFDRFEDAEAALFTAMARASTGKAVTLIDMEPRLRFGKGRIAQSRLENDGA